MCGIFGIVAPRGREASLDDAAIVRLRDRMTHRGPDGAGLWRHENCVLAHRRLAVVDPSPAGAQPMVHADGTGPVSALVYNGELYNDQRWRDRLRAQGCVFRSSCDTETVLHAWGALGEACLPELRGEFAFGAWDVRAKRLTLARDALGVKPLYFARADGGEVVFASDPRVVAAHPGVGARPNWAMVGAYLTSIRTVLGEQTMFDGVYAVRPGEAIEFECAGEAIRERRWFYWRGAPVDPEERWSAERAATVVRGIVEESVRVHLRADVETCALLSGGLDSTVIAALARGETPDLRTYCAGAREGACEEDDDLDVARRAAAALGTRHEEAVVSRAGFGERWRWMVERMGLPLSTPNEVAIYEVAARLRADGCVVTLSGEGADELFAGYDLPLHAAAAYREAAARGEDPRGPGRFEMESNAWMGGAIRRAALRDEVWEAAEADGWTGRWFEDEFARCAEEIGPACADPLAAHLRFHRRVNLTGLLQRLDTATMLASVEGRVPYADGVVAWVAEGLPMGVKIGSDGASGGAERRSGGGVSAKARMAEGTDGHSRETVVEAAPGRGEWRGWETKVCLRRGFAGALPREVVERPKRSFPLPFRAWVGDSVGVLRESPFAREVFTDAAVEMVCARPRELWNLAWPMVNVAMWGEAAFGA